MRQLSLNTVTSIVNQIGHILEHSIPAVRIVDQPRASGSMIDAAPGATSKLKGLPEMCVWLNKLEDGITCFEK
jgi:hypothetical protein